MKKKKGVKRKFKGKIFVGVLLLSFIILLITGSTADLSTPLTGHSVANTSSTFGNVLSKIRQFLGAQNLENWEQGKLDGKVMKYTFFFITLLLIMSVFGSANWPEQGLLRFLIAFFIAFVSVGFVVPEQFLATAPFHGALSLTIAAGLPFAVLILFSSQILQTRNKKGQLVRGKLTVGKIMLQFSMWWAYLLFLGYLSLRLLIYDAPLGKGNYSVVTFIFIILIIATLGIIFFNKKFRKWMISLGREINQEVSKDVRDAYKAMEATTYSESPI